MKTKTIILLIAFIAVVIIACSCYLWIFFGGKYIRISLIGTEYIENSEELAYLEKEQQKKFYLIKKYKYSEYVWAPGYGGGINRTDDYYDLGIANANKQVILKPSYKSIFALKDNKTKAVYIQCAPHVNTGLKQTFYKIEKNKAIVLSNPKD